MIWSYTDFESQIYEIYYQFNAMRPLHFEVEEMNEVGFTVVRQQPLPQGDPPTGSGGDCGVRIDIDEDRCLYKNCSKTHCNVPWHKPCCGMERQDLLAKLKTMICFVASTQVIFGCLPAYAIYLKPLEYDKLYDTTESMFISTTTFSGLFLVATSGIVLSIATAFSMKRLMWSYLMLANILCVYILILSAVKIHFALVVSEKELAENQPIESLAGQKKKELISTGCVCGILMLLGSVLHFMGNGTVYVYYSLKYIQPTLYNMKP